MMYKCCECGHLFEEGEQAVWYENQGECHGITAMEKFSGCPICKGDYEEVHQCKECDEWHTEDISIHPPRVGWDKMFVFLPSVETESFRAFSISDSKNDGVIVISEVIVCGDRIIETISTKNTKSKLLCFEFD